MLASFRTLVPNYRIWHDFSIVTCLPCPTEGESPPAGAGGCLRFVGRLAGAPHHDEPSEPLQTWATRSTEAGPPSNWLAPNGPGALFSAGHVAAEDGGEQECGLAAAQDL